MVMSSLLTTLLALCLPLATTAAAPPLTDWKLSVGWNGTTLAASAVGSSTGAFTPPSGSSAALATKPVAAQSLASTTIGKPGGVFICLNTDWDGTCGYSVQPLNECILFSSPWNEAVSSFGPDPGATCFAYASGNCDSNDAQWSFTFPGDDTGGLATTNPWNDKITSFACVSS